VFFVSADSKGVSDSVSALFATHTRWPISVADKGLKGRVGSEQWTVVSGEKENGIHPPHRFFVKDCGVKVYGVGVGKKIDSMRVRREWRGDGNSSQGWNGGEARDSLGTSRLSIYKHRGA